MANQQNILCLGGPAHLEIESNRVTPNNSIVKDGVAYQLLTVPMFGGRMFYLAPDVEVAKPETILFSYLSATFPWVDATIAMRFAKNTTRTLIFRLSHQAWIYLDVRKLFSGEQNFELTQAEFKRELIKFVYSSVDAQARHAALMAFGQVFPSAFFVTDPSYDPKKNRTLARLVRPLNEGIFNDIYDQLNPKTIEEMQLLAVALSYYCCSNTYLLSTASGHKRINIRGKAELDVTPAQRRYALSVLDSRKFKVPDMVRNQVKHLESPSPLSKVHAQRLLKVVETARQGILDTYLFKPNA